VSCRLGGRIGWFGLDWVRLDSYKKLNSGYRVRLDSIRNFNSEYNVYVVFFIF